MKSFVIGLTVLCAAAIASAQDQPQIKDYYRLYGGPTTQTPPEPQAEPIVPTAPSVSGIINELSLIDQIKQQNRDAAVAFGAYRYQFRGSTQFWMDMDRKQAPKNRFAAGDPLWTNLHPIDEMGAGGYTYNTATVIPGTPVMPVFLRAPLNDSLVPPTVSHPMFALPIPPGVVRTAPAAPATVRQAPAAPVKPAANPVSHVRSSSVAGTQLDH